MDDENKDEAVDHLGTLETEFKSHFPEISQDAFTLYCGKYQERRNCKTVIVEKNSINGSHACPSVSVRSFTLIFRTSTERAFIYIPLDFW